MITETSIFRPGPSHQHPAFTIKPQVAGCSMPWHFAQCMQGSGEDMLRFLLKVELLLRSARTCTIVSLPRAAERTWHYTIQTLFRDGSPTIPKFHGVTPRKQQPLACLRAGLKGMHRNKALLDVLHPVQATRIESHSQSLPASTNCESSHSLDRCQEPKSTIAGRSGLSKQNPAL